MTNILVYSRRKWHKIWPFSHGVWEISRILSKTYWITKSANSIKSKSIQNFSSYSSNVLRTLPEIRRVQSRTHGYGPKMYALEILYEYVGIYLCCMNFRFNGILLSYKNLRILQNIGTIRNDNSDINFQVQADYFIFRPYVGATISGVVNKKSITHLSILVHRYVIHSLRYTWYKTKFFFKKKTTLISF